METSYLVVGVVLFALVCANLPFVTERFMGLVPMAAEKGLHLRALELMFFYGIAGGFGLLLEKRVGQIAPQTWEFYAITASLFLTFAFPGFVYKYLLKHKS